MPVQIANPKVKRKVEIDGSIFHYKVPSKVTIRQLIQKRMHNGVLLEEGLNKVITDILETSIIGWENILDIDGETPCEYEKGKVADLPEDILAQIFNESAIGAQFKSLMESGQKIKQMVADRDTEQGN